ncbi:YXWGXW repeat-containing protein [Telmatocola sphagniphila]|uniref:YXWGXW repeat-containing protein n=1 Tax=Telmatocola sphagniphila TaxID=1123043 RepID=A0A8E6EZ83_9BACT|nr:YXWGXW repeat-containing protein [Telmatocola sphagniphila]QVL33176.1 YXWGXW repeat-containing protein [Telmatocola sphagniphila]
MCSLRSLLLILASAILFGAVSSAYAQEVQIPNIEVLAKGPVHEGFASSSEQAPVPGTVVTKAPPEQIDEIPPDQKPAGDTVVWIPGYWAWDEERADYLWVSGFWRVPPPNRTWVPGSWRKTDKGYQWVAGFWNPIQQQQSEIQYYAPPPAPLDIGPNVPAPNETSTYVNGAWVWKGHWAWRTGYWIEYRPGYIWVPAHYRWTPCGYIFIDGYWDYALADRGMLFAPVYFRTAIYTRPSYYYTPTVWIRDDHMMRALFVRRGTGSYYFGDYFGSGYADRGFTAWISSGNVAVGFAYARGFYDPMFSYYRVTNRTDPAWNRGLVDLYVSRHNNPALRPPSTLIQQNTLVNNFNKSNSVLGGQQIQSVTMLSSIRDSHSTSSLKLQPISESARQDQVRIARQIQDMGRSRAVSETHLISSPSRNADGIQKVALTVPRQLAQRTNVMKLEMPTQIQHKAELIGNPKKGDSIPNSSNSTTIPKSNSPALLPKLPTAGGSLPTLPQTPGSPNVPSGVGPAITPKNPSSAPGGTLPNSKGGSDTKGGDKKSGEKRDRDKP